MFHPLSSLFSNTVLTWEEGDVKYFVERYLRAKIGSTSLRCAEVKQGHITVYAGSAAIHQAIRLIETELADALIEETKTTLKKLVVRIGS